MNFAAPVADGPFELARLTVGGMCKRGFGRDRHGASGPALRLDRQGVFAGSDVAEEDWLADGSLDPLSGTITITGSYLPPLTITLSAASQPAAPGTIRL